VIVPGDVHHEVTALLRKLVAGAVTEPLRGVARCILESWGWPVEHTHRYVPFMSQIRGSFVWERRLLAEPRYPVICDPCQDVQWYNKAELVGLGIVCNLWCDEWPAEVRARVDATLGREGL
jgi:hypothetical protein